LLKRESGFKFHVIDQERIEAQDKVGNQDNVGWKRKYEVKFRRCRDDDQQESVLVDLLRRHFRKKIQLCPVEAYPLLTDNILFLSFNSITIFLKLQNIYNASERHSKCHRSQRIPFYRITKICGFAISRFCNSSKEKCFTASHYLQIIIISMSHFWRVSSILSSLRSSFERFMIRSLPPKLQFLLRFLRTAPSPSSPGFDNCISHMEKLLNT
jgi:hypothetical protein